MAAAVKHTPIPWRTERDLQGDYRIVYNETGNWLAKVYADGESEVGRGADERMLAKDADGGLKMRGRAAAYDGLTRAYLDVLGVKP